MRWFKLVKEKVNGIEELVYKEQEDPLDIEELEPVIPKVVQLYAAMHEAS